MMPTTEGRQAPRNEQLPRDGRHARSARSRNAIVEALLDLLREGVENPSSSQIAERAGVTQRTLFNQFGDMEGLIRAAAARQFERVAPLLPTAGDGTLEERLHRYVSQATELLDETMHIRWVLASGSVPPETRAELIGLARATSREGLLEAFAPELDPLDEYARARALDTVELLTDPVVWRVQRVLQGRSRDEAARLLADAMRRTLSA